ncbi:class I SAM-dependent DNA methyltransferase [Streptomyces sp. NPDC047706]|uniref:class I SAM-dependent DNA methyltransferase n=1 Tax=Streptomyces sp. NPDC047706 TaxID=3365486 RepID=UPI00371C48F4
MTEEAPTTTESVQHFYDAIAEDYAHLFRDELTGRPLERALLTAYAELVGTGGEVADLGCGPGLVTAYLASLGLRVFGLDLSAAMLTVARRANPALRFIQGSMTDLDIPDGRLAGVVSFYSSVHTPAGRLPTLFEEYARVLAPGGHLLLAFQAGDAPLRVDRPFGRPVSLDFQRRDPDRMAALLTRTGFTLHSRTVREPDPNVRETTPQALLIARRNA